MNNFKKALCFAAVFGMMAHAETVAQKDWTVLVFLNGINSLDSFGPDDINEMEKVGSTDHVNVVVEWGSYSARKVKRLLVRKDTNASTVTSPILQDMGLKDMGDYKEFEDFVNWGMKAYPAKHYLVDIWNHGNGWEKSARHTIIDRDMSYDDISGNRITTEQLGTALADIKAANNNANIDIMGFDACLMAMAEVAGEIMDSADYLVGSQDLEPGDGWAYDDFLNAINKPEVYADPKAVAAALVNTYGTSYTNGSQGTDNVTLSTFDLKAFKEMLPALKNLGAALNTVAGTNPQALSAAVSATQAFYISEYRDLGSFVEQLQTKVGGVDGAVIAAVAAQLKTTVTSNLPTGTFQGAQGLSLTVPDSSSFWSEFGTRYVGFKFDQATGWSNWIKNLATFQAAQQ